MTRRGATPPRVAVLALVAVVTAAAADGQTLPESPDHDTTAATSPQPLPARTVRIDAVVTDSKGTPVLTLRAGDFAVVENGVVQRLDAVELRGAPSAVTSEPAAIQIASEADEIRAAREPGTRVIALLLDEFHVSAGEPTERIRAAMRRFVAELVRPTDLLLVLKPLESVTRLQFSRDRQVVMAAIETFQGRKGDYEARTAFEKQYLGSAPEAVRAGRTQIVLSGLRAIVMKLGELQPDRSAIVLASEGFAPDAGPRDRERRVPDVQGLVRAASRFNVAVYTLDPSMPSGTAASDGTDRDSAVLRTLAAATGGEAGGAGGDMRSTLVRMTHDLDAYYVLTYTSSHPADGRFYEVLVRTKRPDVQVRTRSGYWAPLRTGLTTLGAGRTAPLVPLRALRRSPFIETWTGFRMDASGTHVVFTWEPVPGAVARPALAQPNTVALKVSTPAGAVVYEGVLVQARETGGVDTPNGAVFAASPGRLQIDLVILRQDGTRLDTAAQDIDVPDGARPDPRILPPQLFRSTSAREFRELASNAAAAPVTGRAFRRTERLLVRVPTWSPSGVDVKLTVKLVNRVGQSLRDLESITPAPDGVRQYDLPLASLAPGEYRIELTATTQTAVAREAILFRVTG